jgi:hypothetical protein
MDNDLLIYEKEYHLWRNNKYLGTATWTDGTPIIKDRKVKKVKFNINKFFKIK